MLIKKSFSFLTLIFLSQACSSVSGLGEAHTDSLATGDPVISVVELSQTLTEFQQLFFYRDSNEFDTDDDRGTSILLEAEGGTVNSGNSIAYNWWLEVDASVAPWLTLGEINGNAALLTTDTDGDLKPPSESVQFDITIGVITDEGREAQLEAEVVVLANHDIDNSKPWQSYGWNPSEYEDDSGGILTIGGNPNGKEQSNDCTTNGQFFEWLDRGTSRLARDDGNDTALSTVDCYRIEITENDRAQSFFVEELSVIEQAEDATCVTEEDSFLMKIGRQEFCPDDSGYKEFWDEHVPDAPAGSNTFPSVEQQMPFRLARKIGSDNSPVSQYVQTARCEDDAECICDPPEGNFQADCFTVEKLSGQTNIWKLTYHFSDEHALRDISAAGNPALPLDSINGGPGDYYIVIGNESDDTIASGQQNYRITWPLRSN